MKTKFLAALVLCVFVLAATVAALGAVVWAGLDEAQRAIMRNALVEDVGALLLVFALILALLGVLIQAALRAYVARPLALAEETRLISAANPRHRLDSSGPRELGQLAVAINALADRYESVHSSVDMRIAEASRELEKERNLLAALMADLTESVIVFNAAGTILLYNQRARQLFNGADHASGTSDWIGLGRSIFGSLDRQVIAHAIEHLRHTGPQDDAAPVAEFVTATQGGRLLRARMTGVESADDERGDSSAFVVVLNDVQREVQLGSVRERVLKSLTEGSRASLASIRAATESILHYPAMEPAQQQRFLAVIHDESEKLGHRLSEALEADASGLAAEWPLATMLGQDLLRALKRTLEERCSCAVTVETEDAALWVAADSFLLVEGLGHLMRRATQTGAARNLRVRLATSGSRVKLEIDWLHTPLAVDQAIALENEPIPIPGQPAPLSFREIVARHRGEAWYQRNEREGRSAFCLLLPAADEDAVTAPAKARTGTTLSRPVFYDFDLFHQAGQNMEIDRRPLSELAYTVFDTETTGLQPLQGDEIISIGAVRILNGRLLSGETFEQLVNPQRSVGHESSRIHGLTDAMLAGQPAIAAALPRFHRFCDATVLIAHNAAFDMRFLQLKEPATGLKFSHPVLDTLLLSAVVHPNHADHSLEAIAARLGINVIGRHTALGDAMLTGEIFLKLIFLLQEQGIVTFRQAQEASQKTAYAQIRY
jgi:DNA polymerase-3 subunit epsilon